MKTFVPQKDDQPIRQSTDEVRIQNFVAYATKFCMRVRRFTGSSIVLAVVLSTLALGGLVRGEDANYVAHEWGTFTSVQGADGVLLQWNPLETTQLPRFVYDWSKPGMNRLPTGVLNPGSKSVCVSLQRMETPVIYFYSDQDRTVDVTVRFPQGLITEWYPQAHEIGPSAFPPNKLATALDGLVQQAGVTPRIRLASLFARKGIPDSRIQWKQVRILPGTEHPGIAGRLPSDSSGNHYFAARETDADFVQVKPLEKGKPAEYEKLLFYRGVANFKTPLNVTISPGETDVLLRNTGADELRHLFVFAVRRGQGKFVYEKSVPAGQHVNVQVEPGRDLLPSGELVERISGQMSQALVREGLYPREAAAMVKTWRESWFEEDGLRVFYVLPRKWTDETLPLTLDPRPREVVRVMVGRAEIIPPAAEWELLKQIVRYAEPDPANRQQAVGKVKELGLGRFLQPAVQRVLGSRPNREFSRVAWELVNATTKQVDDKTLAAK